MCDGFDITFWTIIHPLILYAYHLCYSRLFLGLSQYVFDLKMAQRVQLRGQSNIKQVQTHLPHMAFGDSVMYNLRLLLPHTCEKLSTHKSVTTLKHVEEPCSRDLTNKVSFRSFTYFKPYFNLYIFWFKRLKNL